MDEEGLPMWYCSTVRERGLQVRKFISLGGYSGMQWLAGRLAMMMDLGCEWGGLVALGN